MSNDVLSIEEDAWERRFHPIRVEQQRRIVKTSNPRVLNIAPDAGIPEDRAILNLSTNAFSLFLSRKGSGKLEELLQALEDRATAQEFKAKMDSQYQRRKTVSLDEGIRQLLEAPAFGELRYAEVTIGQHLFVPRELDLAAFIFQYEGGRLVPEGFTFVQWVKERDSSELEALVIHRDRALTEAERAVAETLGIGLNKPIVKLEKTTLAVTAVGVAAAVTWLAAVLGPAGSSWDIVELGDDVLKKLDEAPSADDLIQIRLGLLSPDQKKLQ
jgi:hypothetical protein